jgi:lia operon protein LiaG
MTSVAIRISSFAAIAAAGAALFVLPTDARAQSERRSLSGDRVAIYNLAGRVQVEGGGDSDVEVEIRRGGNDARSLRIESGTIRSRETLRIVYPGDRIVYPELSRGSRTNVRVREDGTFGDGGTGGDWLGGRDGIEIAGSGSGTEAYADLRIIVPRGKQVDVHLAVGEVRVSNVDGDLSIDVASATITTERTRGGLNLDTGSGAVRVTDAQGDVNLDTGSGGVTVNGIRGTSLNMDTGSGSITGSDIDVRELVADVGSGGIRLGGVRASQLKLETGSGATELEILSNIEQLTIDSGSGGVILHVPASLGAEIEVETGSGGIETDFDVQVRKWERRALSGKIGDGRGRIQIETGSGGVRLLKNK